MNKRGSVVDLLYVLLAMFVLAIVVVIGYTMFSGITTELTNQFPDSTTATKTATTLPNMYLAYNTLFMVIFVFGMLAALVSALFVQTHPVFGVVSIILMILFTFFAAVLSNAYQDFEATSTDAQRFNMVSYFWAHAPKIMLLGLVLVIIVLYAKTRQGGQI